MTTPLLTRDARDLRRLARPPWQRRLLAAAIPLGALVLVAVHTAAVGPVSCTVRDPCGPDPAGSAALGLLAAAGVAGVARPRLAAWFAGGFLAALVVSERVLRASAESPAWSYLVDLAFVGLCALRANLGQDRPPSDRALQWLAVVRRERPPPAALPRRGRGSRLVAVVLAVPASACLLWGWYAQQRADEQQASAERVTASVTAHVDEFTLRVQFGDETATIDVIESRNYPVGERMEFYVDQRGLRQPVSEPYDASGWVFLAVLLAGFAVTLHAHGADQASALRRLFAQEQPVSEVSVLPGSGVVAVYAGDASPGEPAVAEVRFAGAELEPRVQPALLYGVPAPGHWCALAVGGEPILPTRPLTAKNPAAPPFGTDLALLDDGNDDEAPPVVQVPREADLPLRPEQIEVMRPDDRDALSSEVRLHRRSPAVGYVSAAAMPLVVVPIMQVLSSGTSYTTAALLSASLLAVSCALAFRLFLRPRIAWNDRGIAMFGPFGGKRVEWRVVTDIAQDADSVTIHTGYGALVVGAGPMFGVFGRGDRTAEALAAALRHVRSAAYASGHGPINIDAAGQVFAVHTDELPRLERPRPPAGLYALWLLGTPLLAVLLQAFASH
jgi:hypothetical protein